MDSPRGVTGDQTALKKRYDDMLKMNLTLQKKCKKYVCHIPYYARSEGNQK